MAQPERPKTPATLGAAYLQLAAELFGSATNTQGISTSKTCNLCNSCNHPHDDAEIEGMMVTCSGGEHVTECVTANGYHEVPTPPNDGVGCPHRPLEFPGLHERLHVLSGTCNRKSPQNPESDGTTFEQVTRVTQVTRFWRRYSPKDGAAEPLLEHAQGRTGALDQKSKDDGVPHPSGQTTETHHIQVRGSEVPAFHLITEPSALTSILPRLLSAAVVGLDCETTGLDPFTAQLRLVQLAAPGEPVFVVDCFAVDPRLLQPLFTTAQTPVIVGHNLAFDLAFLKQAGISLPTHQKFFDTGLAAQLMEAAPRMPALADLTTNLLGITLDKTHQQADWSRALSPTLLEYAAMDAHVLVPLYNHFTSALKQAGLEQVAAIEFRALPAVVWLRLAGAPFDRDAWRAVADAAYGEKLHLAEELTRTATDLLGSPTLFGRTVNWDSPKQVLELLRQAGLALPDTCEETLRAHSQHPLVALLLAYREASKRCGNYGLEWLRFVHRRTGRVHGDWRQIGTATGRMTCDKPALQTIPRDPRYRACFRPPAGRVLIKADYSQIELRIAAEISGDQRLIAAFAQGADIHALTASRVLGKSLDAVTDDDRQLAKALNFGLLYGMGAATFAQTLRASLALDEEQAKALRERFFAAYPGLRRWHRSQPDGTVEVRTLAGRRRMVERYTDKLNTPVQGTGADGLKLALALLWETQERCPGAVPVLAVHDELVVECDRDQAEDVRAWVVKCMTRGMQTFLRRVPVEVEVTVCRDWSGTPG